MDKPGYTYQAATALFLGKRENQEDAIATDFAIGEDTGFAVLSDGMGGHNAGDIASTVVVTEVFSELKLQGSDQKHFRGNVREILLNAAEIANACVNDVANGAPEAQGMGATLVVPEFIGDALHWLSIGDSPLYLFRSGHLRQLNEDHSMAPHIDLMVRTGMLTESGGRDHPDRNCLTSVLVGDAISKIDCPDRPTTLFDGDIVIAASDGLQYLDHATLSDIVEEHASEPAQRIAEVLLEEIQKLDDPEQDNVSLIIVKVSKAKKAACYQKPLTPVPHPKAEHAKIKTGRSRMRGLRASLARLLPASAGPAE